MNKHIDKIFILIYNDEVMLAETNLTTFYNKIKARDIDIGMGLTTLRKRFEDSLRIFVPISKEQYYYLQKILNEDFPKY